MAQRSPAIGMLLGAVAAGAALAGVAAWWVNLQTIERQAEEKRAAVKKLALSGRIPPNQEVLDYLTAREKSLGASYQHWLEAVITPPVAEAAGADPQLFFQERFHEVQRTLERLAAARSMPVPEQLGFPKELPPSDTVPRLLAQLSLIEQASTLMLEQGVIALASVKVEDPETVPEEDGGNVFLTRVPVRVRLTCSLPQLMKIVGAIQRVRPLIDVRTLRIVSGTPSDHLEVEILLGRSLLTPGAQGSSQSAQEAKRPARKARPPRTGSGRAGRSQRTATEAE